MGALLSTSEFEDERKVYLVELWRLGCQIDPTNAHMKKIVGRGESVGGHVIGGIDDLVSDYDVTVSSKAKRDLIRKLSDGISKALKVPLPSSNASNDEMVAHLMKIVPNPRKGKSIIANKEKQLKLCRDVADIINKNYGNVIDKSLGADGVCNQVSDIVESLSAGLNQEYVAVAASVQRSLQNLIDLKNMLERSYSKLYGEVMNSDDSALKMNSEGIKDVHGLILNEVNRQIAILSNLTNANLRPATRDLAKLLSENRDFKGLVASIKHSVGTSEWGDKLGFWLSGVNNIAQMASAVDKALKVIGMKASEYKNLDRLSDLTMKTHDLMEKLPSNKLTRDFIDKFEKAVEILRKYHGNHENISKRLKTGAGQYFGSADNTWGSYDEDLTFGGRESKDNAYGGYVKLQKKLKTQAQTRKILLRDFKTKSKILMDRMYNSILQLAKRIGSGHIKLSDDLHIFKTTLNDMSVIFREGIEYALTGYYNHANAVEHKERFLSLLRAMLHVLDLLKPQDTHFKDVALNVENMIKLIDFFSDKFKIYTGSVKERTEGSGVSGGEDMGDFGDLVDGGGEFGAALTLQNTKNSFNHFYSIAKFKANLKQVSSEMKTYNKNYETVVGAAIGKEIDTIKTEYNTIKKNLEDTSQGVGSAFNKMMTDNSEGNRTTGYLYTEKSLVPRTEYSKADILQLQETFMNAKIKLYKVAQAIDEYLQKFTDEVATNPDDIREVAKMLSSVQIMANWFTDKSGDAVASLYEFFPWHMRGMRTYHNADLEGKVFSNDKATTGITGHYYEAIGSHIGRGPLPRAGLDDLADTSTSALLPGNPFLPISPQRALKAQRFAEYTVKKVYSLKNIVSAFAYLGNKFGDKKIHSEVFMSPNEIYKSLTEYLYISALTMGWEVSHMVLYGCSAGSVPAVLHGMDYNAAEGTGIPAGMHAFSSSRTAEDGAANNFSVGYVAPTYGLGMQNTIMSTFRIGATHSAAWTTCIEGSYPPPGNIAGELQYGGSMLAGTNVYGNFQVLGSYAGAGGAADYHDIFMSFDQPNSIAEFADIKMPMGTLAGANPIAAHTALIADPDFKQLASNLVPAVTMRRNFGVAMAGIPNHAVGASKDASLSGWKNLFKKEDVIFINCIKAMAAKVFTVTGLYNMLNFADTRNYALNPTRLISGGGKRGGDSFTYQLPKIYDGAVELYARLPLLAEFYRDIFCFEEACTDDVTDRADSEGEGKQILISMVPEVGSLWADFIQVVFDQPANTNGMYTDNALRRMIHTINEIYLVFKSKNPKNTVMAAINDFVAEINSRYGLMTRAEITKYTKEESTRKQAYAYGDEEDIDDFDTLDSDEVGTGVAPSDRFSSIRSHDANRDFEIVDGIYRALRVFRRRIDKRIQAITHTDTGNFALRTGIPDFSSIIMSAKESLKVTQEPKEQYNVVTRMMTGMDTKTQTNKEAHLMFHETIVTPLAVLAAVTNSLQNYERTVHEWDAYALYKGLEKTWNAEDYDTGIPGLEWQAWAGQILNPAAAWANRPYRATIGTVINAIGGGAYATTRAQVTDRADCKAEAYIHMDMPRNDRVRLYERMIENLHRDENSVFPGGIMGLNADTSWANVVTSLDLLWSRAWGSGAAIFDTVTPTRPTLRAHYKSDGGAPHGNFTAAYDDMSAHMTGIGDDHNYGPHRLVAYLSIRWEALLRQMVSLVYGLTSDLGKMCEVKFRNEEIVVDHAKLQVVCEEIMATIRKNIDKFRGIISGDTLRRYEAISSPGSINWVQQHLLDNLFGDKNGRGLKRAHGVVTKNFSLIANKNPDNKAWSVAYHGFVNFQRLTGGSLVPLSGIDETLNPNNERRYGWCVEDVFAELTHYNSRTLSSNERTGANIVGPPIDHEPQQNFAQDTSLVPVWTHHDAFEYLMKDTSLTPGQTNRQYAHQLFKGRYDYYLQNSAQGEKESGFRGDSTIGPNSNSSRIMYDEQGNVLQTQHVKSDVGEGLMMKFNEVMGAYVRQFWDIGSSKIYAPLIDAPANGPLNQEVFKARGWPDMSAPILGGAVNDGANSQPWQYLVTDPIIGALGSGGAVVRAWGSQFLRYQTAGLPEPFAPSNYDKAKGHRNTWQNAFSTAWSLITPGNADMGTAPFNAPAVGTSVGSRVIRYSKAAQRYQEALADAFGTHWIQNINTQEYSSKYRFPVVAGGSKPESTSFTILPEAIGTGPGFIFNQADYGAAIAGSGWGYNPGGGRIAGAEWPTAGQVIGMGGTNPVGTPGNFETAHTGGVGSYATDYAVGSKFMPETSPQNHCVLITSLRYINKLKRAFLYKTREVQYFNVTELREFIYRYISDILGNEIYNGEVYRLETIVRLQPNQGNVPTTPYDINRVSLDIVRRLYGTRIAANANRLKAFIIEKVLYPFATTVFREYANTLQIGSTQPVTGLDIIACVSSQVIPCVTAWSGLIGASFIGQSISMSGFVVNVAGNGAANFLGNLRSFYAFGGTHRFEDISLFIAGGDMAQVSIVGAINQPIYNEVYRRMVEVDNEYEGRYVLGGSIWATGAAAGSRVNMLTGAVGTRRNNNVFDAYAAGLYTPDIMSKLFGCGYSNISPLWLGGGATAVHGLAHAVGSAVAPAILPSPLDLFDLLSIHGNRTVGTLASLTSVGGILRVATTNVASSLATEVAGVMAVGFIGNDLNAAPLTVAHNHTIMAALFTAAIDGYRTIPDTIRTRDGYRAILDNAGNLQEISPFIGHIGDPNEILFASIAKALRTALAETGRNNIKTNIIQSIAEVPLRMKETFKADLPIFIELFKLIIKKSDLLRNVIKMDIGLDRTRPERSGGRMEIKGVYGSVSMHGELTREGGRSYYMSLIDKISAACASMVSAASSVLNELNDAPLYLEVSENSITDYKNSNGKLPFMPLSSMANILQWPERQNTGRNRVNGIPARHPELGYPTEGPGSELFAFNYGTRLVIHDYNVNPMIEHLPGMAELLRQYNVVSHGQKKMESKTAGAFIGKIVTLLRYAASSRLYSGLFGADRRVVDAAIHRNMSNEVRANHIQALANPPFQATTSVATVLELTTSSDYDSRSGEVVSFVLGTSNNSAPISRGSSMIYNILDLNISPINVHAMRRELPLANLYNYAYTFDSFVSELVESTKNDIDNLQDATTHDVLAVLLKNPYVALSRVNYYKNVGNIIKGYSSLDLYGHPKFVSDQIWNKALFNETVEDTTIGSRRRDRRPAERVNYNGPVWHQAANVEAAQLHYLSHVNGQTNSNSVMMVANSVGGDPSVKGYLTELGRLRFDTKFIRNLVFLANVQRIMTHKIDNELSKVHFPVVSDAAVTNRKITDYHDRETHADLVID